MYLKEATSKYIVKSLREKEMKLKINGEVDFKTLGELKRYITDVLGIPAGCLKFVTTNGGTAQNTTNAEEFFANQYGADVSNAKGFTYHATATNTIHRLKENIAEHLCIPLDSIRIVWEDNSDVAENTLVGNFRESW